MHPDTLFPCIYDMSAVASIVIVAVLILRFYIRKLPKRLTMLLWAVVLFRLFCPIAPESDISLIPQNTVSYAQNTALEESAQISTTSAAFAVYQAVGDMANGGLDILHVPLDEASTDTADTDVQPIVSARHSQVWLLFLGKLWLPGAALLLMYGLYSYLRLRRAVRISAPLRGRADALMPCAVYTTDGLPTAFVLGILRPRIYLPSALSRKERSIILVHEQVHILHHDHIWKLLAFCALCVHWFNPLVWTAFFLSARDMEMYCDESAAAILAEEQNSDVRADYAEALLRLSGRQKHPLTILAFGEGDTARRIRRILRLKPAGRWMTRGAAALCVCAVLVCAVNPLFPFREDSVSQANLNGKAIPASEGQRLITRINSHRRTENLTYDSIGGGTLDHTAVITLADNSVLTLNYLYVSGYSFAHSSEDPYKSVLWHHSEDGTCIGTWVMEYDFDAVFREWMHTAAALPIRAEVICGTMRTEIYPLGVPYDQRVDYNKIPSVTVDNTAAVVLSGIGAEHLTVSCDYYAALSQNGTQIQRESFELSADDSGLYHLTAQHKNPSYDEHCIYYIGAEDARYVFRIVYPRIDHAS